MNKEGLVSVFLTLAMILFIVLWQFIQTTNGAVVVGIDSITSRKCTPHSNECFSECAVDSSYQKSKKLQVETNGPCEEPPQQTNEQFFCTSDQRRSTGYTQPIKEVDTIDVTKQCICLYQHHHIPICGTDGVTYPNKCALDCGQVSDIGRKISLEAKYEGACKDEISNPVHHSSKSLFKN